MSGCPQCGEPEVWGGMSWIAHADHGAARKRLLRALRGQLGRAVELRAWEAQNAAQQLVGVRWRCGVYPGWGSEERSVVPQAVWDAWGEGADGGHEGYLRNIRTILAAHIRLTHGVEVNQATWFYRVYDPRERADEAEKVA